jgi:hypothetical protein
LPSLDEFGLTRDGLLDEWRKDDIPSTPIVGAALIHLDEIERDILDTVERAGGRISTANQATFSSTGFTFWPATTKPQLLLFSACAGAASTGSRTKAARMLPMA